MLVKIKINKHYENILKIIEEKFDSDQLIRSVVGIGSYFSGQYDTGSDIDIILLSDIEKDRRYFFDIEGTSYDFFLFGINKFTVMLNGLDACFVPAMAFGEIVYDVDDIGVNLKNLAISIYNRNRNSASAGVLNGSRLRIFSCIRKIRYGDIDKPLFYIMYGKLVLSIYKLLCVHHQVWERSEKHMLIHIKELSAELHAELILCCDFENRCDVMHNLQIILDRVFNQIGGISNIKSMVI